MMKKYWKVIVVIAIAVVGIGTFYVNSAISVSKYPEFVIKKQSGDETEIKSLVVEGTYSGSVLNEGLKITADGSRYESDSSFIDLFKGYNPPLIEQLQEEYRNFMRGKSGDISAFYEDKQFLVNANGNYKAGGLAIEDFKIEISILDKKSNETNSFTIKVPNGSSILIMDVVDVQLIDNKVKLISQNYIRKSEGYHNEYHMYTIDVREKEIINHQTIFSVPERQSDSHFRVNLIRETNPKQAHDFVVFSKTISKEIKREPNVYTTVDVGQELISYNLKTKETENIKIPENLKNKEIRTFDGSTVYFTEASEKSVEITSYNTGDKTIANTITLDRLSTKSSKFPEGPILTIYNDRVYAITRMMNEKDKSNVIVADLNSGEILFDGKITKNNPSKKKGGFEIFFHEMGVK